MSSFRITLTLAGVFILCWLARCTLGHESRTIDRLMQTGIISNSVGIKLIYSTGYTRENIHVFRVPTKSLNLNSAHLVDRQDQYQVGYIETARHHLEKYVKQAVDWDHAEVFEMEGSGILAFITVIKEKSSDALVILHVF